MRASRPEAEIDRELRDLANRRLEACSQITALLVLIAGIESRQDVLLDRRAALTAGA
jgi:hypothetical protein